MASTKYKYLFQIDGTDVYPVWSPESNLRWEEESEFVFKRLKLNGTFTLLNKGVRKDFNFVWAKDLDHEFTFLAQYIVDGVVAEEINGTFYKTDCPFWDEDNERVDVVVTTIDKYEKLMKAYNKEFDLVGEIQPESYRVNIKREPQIQIAFPYHDTLYGRVGSTTFIQDLPTTYTSAQLEAFGFIHQDEPMVYIPGSGDMSPDVSGIYLQSGINEYDRQGGIYFLRRNLGTSKWEIRDGSSNVIYIANDSGSIPGTATMLDRSPFIKTPQTTFVSVDDPAVTCAAFPVWYHQRILTNADTVGGDTTIALPVPDIGGLEFNYTKYIDQSGLTNLYINIEPSDWHSTTPTKFGKFNEDAEHFPDLYFSPTEEPFVGTKSYAVMNPSWTEYSIMEYIGGGLNDEMIEATTDEVLRDAYPLADCIQKILAQIDTNLVFYADVLHSKFLFDSINPVSGDAQALTHFITPKSNILESGYSQPDTKEMITFGAVDRLLRAANLWWWIDNNYNFRIEHISYFKNGRSYTAPIVGVNLTTLIDPRTGKAWGYHTKNYRYTKEKMPEELKFAWQDEVSEYFRGYPIKINSGFVEKGLFEELSVEKFSSDITLALSFPDNFATDGFFVFGAEFADGEFTIPFESFSVSTFTNVLVQNGWWSFYYLHDKFWRHNLPAEDVNINNVDVTAETTKRGKEQTLRFPSGVNPDPMRLVTSGIGNCEITEMEINLVSRECTIKVLGDLDFDNPCPTC